jgi:sugar O-acyltransferase (sialic acid O-acetyltransferase NeuD family)
MKNNKFRLFIIGASGFGREIENWLHLVPEVDRDWIIEGYLDIDANALNGYPARYKVVGFEGNFNFETNDRVILAVSDCGLKEKIVNSLKHKVQFFTFIAPSCIIAHGAHIGEGTVVSPNSIISTNAHIGDFVTINVGTQIGHDASIGSFSSLMSHVDISGHVVVGKNVYIGTQAMVFPSRRINDNAKIGAGSVVIQHVKSRVSVFGNPARAFN